MKKNGIVKCITQHLKPSQIWLVELSKHSVEISRGKVTGGECFSRRLKRAEYRLKTEQLIKANSKVHPKRLWQLLNTTFFNMKSHILTVSFGIIVHTFNLREKHSPPPVTIPREISTDCFDISTSHI